MQKQAYLEVNGWLQAQLADARPPRRGELFKNWLARYVEERGFAPADARRSFDAARAAALKRLETIAAQPPAPPAREITPVIGGSTKVHSINLEPVHDCLEGRELTRLVDLWLEWQALRLPADTLRSYRARVEVFTAWWEEVGPGVGWLLTEVTLGQFAAWLQTATARGGGRYAWHSQNDILRRLRQCLRWAYARHYVGYDVARWVPAPEGGAPLRLRASLEQLGQLMDGAGRGANVVRDQAYIALLLGTGLRRAEAVALDVEDVRMDATGAGTIVIRKAKKVKGRDVQGRVIAFDEWAGAYLRRQLDRRPARGPLFTVPDGDARMSLMAANRLVKRAGLEGAIQGPHDLRRAFATHFALQNQGNPLAGRLLQKQLGHSTFQMTDHYILHDAEDLRAVIRSPLV